MSHQSGEWLTWFYFGYSEAFGMTIAIVQILGAYLLLFRKSLLFGLLILFALMLNITLINIFYHMNAGALIQSLITTIGIAFLLILDYERIKKLLFNSVPSWLTYTTSSNRTKNALRLFAIISSILFTIYLKFLMG
ncbi:hypothetical protein C3K47_02070 [Solitalea longa]|uniref:DoxX family protein n=1 Tax=Solitalea longa TaxID=2079460 RepID=A0A2S5A9V4_9SPHI|nr:hypothetical protein [Solitalea longa]POY39306.1 hypothetical protein C3K47_02070 [Solitalea longa]